MLGKINWHPSNTDLRKFGSTLIIGFGLIGGLVFWKASATVAYWMWSISVGIGIIALIAPPAGKPFYWLWMGIAFVMGNIISTLIMLFIFYFIFTPVGIFMKIIGRDALRLKKKSFPSDTYWSEHADLSDKKLYERLF